MVTNCVKWILTALVFCQGVVSVTATNTNCNPELNVSDTLWLSDFTTRLTFEVHPDHSAVSVCGLQAGEKYSLLLHSLVPEANGSIKWSAPGFSTYPKTDQIQEFVALEDCAVIQLISEMNFSVASTLSLGCMTCDSAIKQRSMMGIQVDPGYSATQLVEDVFISGNCFSVESSSINFTGYNQGLGYFNTGGDAIDIEEGVMISTGNATNAIGPNVMNSTTSELQANFTPNNDVDLRALINNAHSLYDTEILEFDFVPTSSEISFDYVFASEEYCEYADSDFNDVFGFFISGPGINGPFTNNAENIAQLPGSSDYITINNVNDNTNNAYYVNNIPASHFVIFPFVASSCAGHPVQDGPANNFIEFDAFTTVLTARATVIPCETYHIKLAIADVTDRRFDSAVFLRANSFTSDGAATGSTELPDAFNGFALEGCIGGQFVFQRQDSDLNEPLTVHYTLSPLSTAEEGIDFLPLPDSIIIPAGEEFYYLPVEVYEDFIPEGNETIILDLESPCSCANPFVEMTIADPQPLTLNLDDQALCEPDSAQIEALPTGGLANYSYQWNTGDTSALLSVFPQSDTTYFVTVTDFCGREIIDSVSFSILGIPEATIVGDFEICPEGDPAFLEILFSTTGTYTITYTIDGVLQAPISNITDNPFVLETTTPGIYELVTMENQACTGLTFGTASVAPLDVEVQFSLNEVSCPGQNDGSILIQVSGGLPPYSYQWNHTAEDTPALDNLAPGQYFLTITEAGGCTVTQDYQIVLSSTVPFAEAGTSIPLNCSKTEISLIANGSVGGTYTYLWTTPDGNILSGATTTNPLVNASGTYTFAVTNEQTNCTITDEVFVPIDTIAPVPAIIALGPLTLSCTDQSTLLDASTSQPFGALTFAWSSNNGLVPPAQSDNPQIEVEQVGDYWVEVTDTTNGCTAIQQIEIDADTLVPIGIIASPDLLTCRDSIVTIDASASSSGAEFSYRWSSLDGNMVDGITSLFLEVDAPGWYELQIVNSSNGCQTVEVVEVQEDRISPVAEVTDVEELDCDSPSVILDGSGSSQGDIFQYLWRTDDGNIVGDSTSLFSEIDAQGTYYLVVTNDENGCTASGFIFVTENTNRPYDLEIAPVAPRCYGDLGSFAIEEVLGGVGPFVFSYDDGESFSGIVDYQNMQPGQYHLMVQDANGCEFVKEFSIPNVPARFVLLDPEIEILLGENGYLSAVTNITDELVDSIVWTPIEGLSCTDCLDPEVAVLNSTRYSLTVIDTNGCKASDEILLRVRKERNVYIPNAFSPNGDGINDIFFINSDANSVKQINRFCIYDRWGATLFESDTVQPNDPAVGWDGIFRGKELDPGVYTYYAEIEFVDGLRQLYKGDVSLIK